MKRFVLNSTVATIALLTASSAFANDYNSGVVSKSPSQGYTDVEYGSGWYLRGDISYNIRGESESGAATLAAPTGAIGVQADYDDSVGARIGAGYYVNSNFRLEGNVEGIFSSTFSGLSPQRFGGSRDVNVLETDASGERVTTPDTIFFNSNGDVTGSNTGTYQRIIGNRANTIDGTEEIEAEYSATSFMVNGYYDLPTMGKFTPYVGAGVGLGRLNYSQTRTLTCIAAPEETCAFPPGTQGERTEQELTLSDEFWAFAYQLNIGAAYRVSDRMSVDVGYSFTDFAGGEDLSYSDGTAIDDDGFKLHQVRAGIRYDIW